MSQGQAFDSTASVHEFLVADVIQDRTGLTEEAVTINLQERLHAIRIGIFVANFLLNTSRGLEAIELCKECLILLNNKTLADEQFAMLVRNIYLIMFRAYCFILDYKNSVQYGKKALLMYRERGDLVEEAKLSTELAITYQNQRQFEEAQDLYERTINIFIETGDRKREADSCEKISRMFCCRGKLLQAKEYLEKALEIRKDIGDKKGEAENYKDLGTVFQSLREFNKAKEHLFKALEIRVEIRDRKGEAEVYENLGAVLQSLSEHGKAKENFEKALLIRIEIGDRKGEAEDYGSLGTVFQSLGIYDKAKEYHEKALATRIEVGDRKGEGGDYGNLGAVFRSVGEYDKAKEYLEKAIALSISTGDRKSEASSCGNLGIVFKYLGQYTEAKEYHEKALAIRKEIGDRKGEAAEYGNLGTVFHSIYECALAKEYLEKALVIATEICDREGEASACANLGTVFRSFGEYERAKEYLEKALEISKELGNRKGEAADYGNLGTVFQCLGENSNAVKYHKKALAIRMEIGDRRGEAADYGNLGTVFQSLGEYAKAKDYLERALAIRMEIGDRRGEAADYGNLGTVFQSLGEYAKAKDYLEKALAIRIEIDDRKGIGADYGNIGTVFLALGEYDKGIGYLEKALAIRIEIGDRRGEAAYYGNLGTAFQSQGNYEMAKEYHGKALAIRKEIGDREGEVLSYGNLGTVFLDVGEYVQAEEYLEKALSISRDIADREKEFRCSCNLALVKLSVGKIQEAFQCLFRNTEKCEELRRLLADNDQFKISFSDEHVDHYQVFSAVLCAARSFKEALYVVELGRARALADLMESQYDVMKPFSANQQSWVGIESIMKKESNNTCLYISYYAKDIFMWILKTSGDIHFRRVPVKEEILKIRANFTHTWDEFFAKTFRAFRLIVDDDEDEECENENSHLSLLYKILIAPVVDLFDGHEIVIVPDRLLYKIPFAALSDENGRYLSETFRIRIVPSLTTLKFIQDSPADYHSQTGALIVGDPDVGRVRYKGRRRMFSRLPCARKEVEMIGQLLGVQPLLGQNATKQAVFQMINSVSLIHFSAHGDAERGEIALCPIRSSTRFPREEDYLLTMSDISRVQLRAKLVVLSCCHSGGGQITTEGVVGIARAFLGSGARSVLASLWALEDTATEQFMNRFYVHLVCGESASKSLHEAMKWMRANGFSDVRQWAPFMLIGDDVTFNFAEVKAKRLSQWSSPVRRKTSKVDQD